MAQMYINKIVLHIISYFSLQEMHGKYCAIKQEIQIIHTQRTVQPDQCYFTVQITGINFEGRVIQQSEYLLHFYYTLYDGKYDCKITMH